MSETVIKLENISKRYQLGLVGTNTLTGDLQSWWYRMRGKEDPTLKIGQENQIDKTGGAYVWALKDINLDVKQGEILGIIGKNGAGKSTLLKLLSQVTGPTTGAIKVKGRIASLLEVGTGFHAELTGKENIFLNGAILGMTKNDIKRKLDEIVEFAGVAKYLDTPVKRYSSGMYVRLAFAVAAHLEPDILVVDEVLAVGDAEFQKKAIGKMQDVSRGGGRTVLFVSHNMASIQKLCEKVLILENGQKSYFGETANGIKQYLGRQNKIKDKTGYTKINSNNASFSFIGISILNKKNKRCFSFSYTEDIIVKIGYKIKKVVGSFVLLFRVTDDNGNIIFTSWDSDAGISRLEIIGNNYNAICIIPANLLKKGIYHVTIASHIPNIEILEYYENLISFEIDVFDYKLNLNRAGFIIPKLKWEITK